ncbi:MAG: SDR family NAD(P)-dependent oxidoreductase [Gammaproteobacteria bacterium]
MLLDFEKFKEFFDDVQHSIQSQFGADKIDYLINNAGIGSYFFFRKQLKNNWIRFIIFNLKGTYLLTQNALKILNNGSGIINVSTGLTRFCLNGFRHMLQ